LFLKEVTVKLIASLADWQTTTVLVEHFNLLVVKIIRTISQLAHAMEVILFDTLEWGIA
jgi:hypothetical protein